MTAFKMSPYLLRLVAGAIIVWVIAMVWMAWTKDVHSEGVRNVTERGKLTSDEQNTIEVFERNSPAVVYITTTQRVINPWTRNVNEIPSGTGTGFIWDDKGHIVTNYHVIEGFNIAKVRMSDQRLYDAQLVGASPEHDLAVLRLAELKDLPKPVQIGTSHDLKVGQKVMAIGNPFGLDHTLTSGIVSALGRSIDGDNNQLDDLIQTDAAINPGNSGGPLLDSAGRVVGVSVAIYSPSGASAGIGFAIPVDTVNRVIPQLVRSGHYERPILGISMKDEVNAAVTRRLGVKGVLVLQVTPRSPAEAAGIVGTQLDNEGGLILGDIIQSIDGKPVTKVADVSRILDTYKRGDTVKVKLLRDGTEPVEVSVKLTQTR